MTGPGLTIFLGVFKNKLLLKRVRSLDYRRFTCSFGVGPGGVVQLEVEDVVAGGVAARFSGHGDGQKKEAKRDEDLHVELFVSESRTNFCRLGSDSK